MAFFCFFIQGLSFYTCQIMHFIYFVHFREVQFKNFVQTEYVCAHCLD